MECKKCGKEITLDDGVVYCPYCGAKLKGEEAPKTRNILLRELKGLRNNPDRSDIEQRSPSLP